MDDKHYDDYEKTEVILNFEADKISYPRRKNIENNLKTTLVTEIKFNKNKLDNKEIIIESKDDFINVISSYEKMKLQTKQFKSKVNSKDINYFVKYQKPDIEENELTLSIDNTWINKRINWDMPNVSNEYKIKSLTKKELLPLNNLDYKYVIKEDLVTVPKYPISTNLMIVKPTQDKLISMFNLNDYKIKGLAKYNLPIINRQIKSLNTDQKLINKKVIWMMPEINKENDIKYVEVRDIDLLDDLNYQYVNKMCLKALPDSKLKINLNDWDGFTGTEFKISSVNIPIEINLSVKKNEFEINDNYRKIEISELKNLNIVEINKNEVAVNLFQLPKYNKVLNTNNINYQMYLNEVKVPDLLQIKLYFRQYKPFEYKNKVELSNIDCSLSLSNEIKSDICLNYLSVPDYVINKIDDINIFVDLKETKLPQIQPCLIVDNITIPAVLNLKNSVDMQFIEKEVSSLIKVINDIVPEAKVKPDYNKMMFDEPIDVYQFWVNGGDING